MAYEEINSSDVAVKVGKLYVSCYSTQPLKPPTTVNSPAQGGQNEIVWIIGGQVRIHVQSMRQTREVWGHAPLGNFDFGTFIRRNLVESGTVFAQIIYCVINTLLRIGLIYM